MASENLRVAFFLPSLPSYRNRAHMVSEIAERVDEGVLLTLDRGDEAVDLEPALDVVEVPGSDLPGGNQFRASRRMADLVRNRDLDLVHDTFGSLAPLLLWSRRFPGTTFVTSQYILAEWELRRAFLPRYGWHKIYHEDVRRWIRRSILQRLAVHKADHVVLQAPGLVDRLTEIVSVPRSKVSWIPNSVRGITPDGNKGQSWEPDGPVDILYVANFSIPKGADHLIAFLDEAAQRGLDVNARVIGRTVPIDQPELREAIADRGVEDRISFEGRIPRSEVQEAYHESDWLFHVSRREGSPRVVLEAMAHGLPVIGSTHPGIEVLDPDREAVAFVDESPAREAVEEVLACRDDPGRYRDRVERGLRIVEDNFTSQHSADKHVELYRELAG